MEIEEGKFEPPNRDSFKELEGLRFSQRGFIKGRNSVAVAGGINYWAAKLGRKFRLKTVKAKDGTVLGTRIWRIE